MATSPAGGHAYDASVHGAQAIDRANSTDKAKVRDEIERDDRFVGTGGIFNMSPTDHLVWASTHSKCWRSRTATGASFSNG